MSSTLNNLMVLAIFCALIFTLLKMRKNRFWQEAWKRLGKRTVSKISLGIIILYSAIALLDSIEWKDRPEDMRPRTVIDRIFERKKERTYSAPGAKTEIGQRNPRSLEQGYHLLGTDSIGDDVFYKTIKGCRTAIIIGGFTTILIIPIALLFGIPAGFFGGWIDDLIQYIYTIMASIPEILFLISLMIALGKGLPQICIAMGITSWVGLCRLIRGETLKLREKEYIQAARALGVGNFKIMIKHILPNLTHIIIITFVLRFSGLVLSEVILSYLGVGVNPGTGSWGSMIEGARLELSRDPIVWWNLMSTSIAMLILVLAFNLFGDALRDALDPRLRGEK